MTPVFFHPFIFFCFSVRKLLKFHSFYMTQCAQLTTARSESWLEKNVNLKVIVFFKYFGETKLIMRTLLSMNSWITKRKLWFGFTNYHIWVTLACNYLEGFRGGKRVFSKSSSSCICCKHEHTIPSAVTVRIDPKWLFRRYYTPKMFTTLQEFYIIFV